MLSRLDAGKRTTLFYFAQFMAGGAANAYAGIWFSDAGLSAQQIGIVTSAPVLVLLLSNIFVGRIADRASDWRQVIIVGAIASALCSLGLFLPPTFLTILIFFALTTIFQSLIVPVADAAAMHLAEKTATNFGTFRAFSTLGYLLALFISGFLLMWQGAWLFVPLFVGLSFVRAIISLLLPRFKSPAFKNLELGGHHFKQLLQAWFFLPLVGWSIVYATHFVLNSFQSLLWSQQGYSGGLIGLLIGVGAASEAVAFFLFRFVPKSINLRVLIVCSGVVTVGRWLAMMSNPSVALLVPLQMLHGITYALGFLACVNFIGRNTSATVAAEAQSVFMVMQQIAAIVVITIFSWLAGQHGSTAYFGNAMMALFGTLLIALALCFKPPAPIALDRSA